MYWIKLEGSKLKWSWIDSTPSHTCIKLTLYKRHLHFRHRNKRSLSSSPSIQSWRWTWEKYFGGIILFEYPNHLICKIPDIFNMTSDTIYERNYQNRIKKLSFWIICKKTSLFHTVQISTIFWWWCLGAGSSCQVLWECHPSLMPTQIQLLPWQKCCLLAWFHWES